MFACASVVGVLQLPEQPASLLKAFDQLGTFKVHLGGGSDLVLWQVSFLHNLLVCCEEDSQLLLFPFGQLNAFCYGFQQQSCLVFVNHYVLQYSIGGGTSAVLPINFINSFYMELMARQPAQPVSFDATQQAMCAIGFLKRKGSTILHDTLLCAFGSVQVWANQYRFHGYNITL